MVERTITIENESGLHARPAAMLVRHAAKFASDITLIKDGLRVNGKSIMGVMMLAAEQGSQIQIIAAGDDEESALQTIVDLIENQFQDT
jgi:phosphocarrier protein